MSVIDQNPVRMVCWQDFSILGEGTFYVWLCDDQQAGAQDPGVPAVSAVPKSSLNPKSVYGFTYLS
ncbi:MAG: hypothetical protein HFI65_09875 [Lachnospiraceae bacterium]|nr:hypothetical protein [Lachnospiraceae bacterium]